MIYLLDGYNLLFSLIESKKSLSDQRNHLISFLQKQFSYFNLSGTLVFDGSHRREEESGISYKSPLEIAYAPKGQSADMYIVEKIEITQNPRLIVVVTDDRGLASHARSHGAKVQTNRAFLDWLSKKAKKRKKEKKLSVSETPKNMERLLKAFEERLKDIHEDYD